MISITPWLLPLIPEFSLALSQRVAHSTKLHATNNNLSNSLLNDLSLLNETLIVKHKQSGFRDLIHIGNEGYGIPLF